MIAAAGDAEEARLVVDRAEAAMGSDDRCMFCALMLAVPAAMACADVGDLEEARRHLRTAEESAAMWEGAAWPAALLEARAHLASAEGRADEAVSLQRPGRGDVPSRGARSRRPAVRGGSGVSAPRWLRGLLLLVLEDPLARELARRADDAAAGVRAGSALVVAVDRGAVLAPARGRAEEVHLRREELAGEDVALGEPGAALDVDAA